MRQIKLTLSLFWEFFRFMWHPNAEIKQEEWNFAATARVFSVRFMFFVFVVILYILIQVLPSRKLEAPSEADIDLVKNLPFWIFLILGTIILPVGEELMMRLPMRISIKNILFSFFAGVIVFLFFTQLQLAKLYHFHQIEFEWSRILPPTVVTAISLVYLYVVKKKLGNSNMFFGIYMYLMAILFGVLHRYQSIHSPLDVLYTIPETFMQISSGFFYTFIRMKYGLRMSITTHSFWNFTVIVAEKIAV